MGQSYDVKSAPKVSGLPASSNNVNKGIWNGSLKGATIWLNSPTDGKICTKSLDFSRLGIYDQATITITAEEFANRLLDYAKRNGCSASVQLPNGIKVTVNPNGSINNAIAILQKWANSIQSDRSSSPLVTVGNGSPAEASRGTGAPKKEAGASTSDYTFGDFVYDASAAFQRSRTAPLAKDMLNNNPWLKRKE